MYLLLPSPDPLLTPLLLARAADISQLCWCCSSLGHCFLLHPCWCQYPLHSFSICISKFNSAIEHRTWLPALSWSVTHASSSWHQCKCRIHEVVARYKDFLGIHSGPLPINNVTLLSVYQQDICAAPSCVLSSPFFFEVCIDMDTDLHSYTSKWSIWCSDMGKLEVITCQGHHLEMYEGHVWEI